jgi:hypothetical protein
MLQSGELSRTKLFILAFMGILPVLISRVVDPYSFFTDPDPDPELDVGGQYGSGSKSGSGSNTDPGL